LARKFRFENRRKVVFGPLFGFVLGSFCASRKCDLLCFQQVLSFVPAILMFFAIPFSRLAGTITFSLPADPQGAVRF
jgi:hypothetical protein